MQRCPEHPYNPVPAGGVCLVCEGQRLGEEDRRTRGKRRVRVGRPKTFQDPSIDPVQQALSDVIPLPGRRQ